MYLIRLNELSFLLLYWYNELFYYYHYFSGFFWFFFHESFHLDGVTICVCMRVCSSSSTLSLTEYCLRRQLPSLTFNEFSYYHCYGAFIAHYNKTACSESEDGCDADDCEERIRESYYFHFKNLIIYNWNLITKRLLLSICLIVLLIMIWFIWIPVNYIDQTHFANRMTQLSELWH